MESFMSLLAALVKSQNIVTLPPTATVFEASRKMAQFLIGSILIVENDGTLVGIFTERDLLNRVVAKDLDPKKTLLSEVMSKNVTTVSLSETTESCFLKMESTKCRHIPIMEGKKLVGVVTMRNILEWLTKEMEEENVFLKNYIQS
jgi:signal-transduction protein with cAMP-binding, CBS, and nucleotidyltransferase domain